MANPVKNEALITEAETAALEALADLPLARAGSGEDGVEGNGGEGNAGEVLSDGFDDDGVLMMMYALPGAH